MITLLTIADIRKYKSMSLNVNFEKDVEPYIREAQQFELSKFIGQEFYMAVEADAPTFSAYNDLWFGCTYTYSGRQYFHKGLEAVLVYHAYARYSADANAIATGNGFVIKESSYSNPVNSATIARKVEQARSGAYAHEEDVKEFLNRNASDYPLWRCCDTSAVKRKVKIRRV